MDVGPAELGLILIAVMLLFGYKKMPDAARSMGRSLRIFRGEMAGMRAESSQDAAAQAAGTPPAPVQALGTPPAATQAASTPPQAELGKDEQEQPPHPVASS